MATFSWVLFLPFVAVYVVLSDDKVTVDNVLPPYYTAALKAEEYSLPDLQWGTNDLEPFIDGATIEAHYRGHHNTYRVKLNAVLTQWREQVKESENGFANQSILKILQDLHQVPDQYLMQIINNGGGFVNHALYWACLSPNPLSSQRVPTPAIADAISDAFGTFDAFKAEFTQKALTLFGSGYVWLVRNGKSGNLYISTSANQDSPISDGHFPILVIDVWEHAYYLKHQFRRPAYVKDWWMIVDWDNVEKLDQFWMNDMEIDIPGNKDEL